MPTSYRNRCRYAILTLCIALIIIAIPANARSAEYWVMEGGVGYHAVVVVNDTNEFFWWEMGLLGERIPLEVENISLRNLNGGCDPCPFNRTDPNRITFNRGNYSLGFDGAIHNNHFITEFGDPTEAQVHLPPGFDVRNPLLGSVSRGGEVAVSNDSSITIQWTDTRIVEFRFYDPGREVLLATFFTVWVVIAIILLFPYVLMRRKR